MKHFFPCTNVPLPTASGVDPAIARIQAEQRNNSQPNKLSHDQHIEMIARGLAEHHGCYIHGSIIGLVVRSIQTDEVVAEGFLGFAALIEAAEKGEITWEVSRA